jgi:hypothetical protein
MYMKFEKKLETHVLNWLSVTLQFQGIMSRGDHFSLSFHFHNWDIVAKFPFEIHHKEGTSYPHSFWELSSPNDLIIVGLVLLDGI